MRPPNKIVHQRAYSQRIEPACYDCARPTNEFVRYTVQRDGFLLQDDMPFCPRCRHYWKLRNDPNPEASDG